MADEPLKHVCDLYAGFLQYANEHGQLRVGDQKSIEQIASLLGLDTDIMQGQMQVIDMDHNGYIGFADFALWADRHTRSIALGLDVPAKESWRDGCPDHWTSIPPPPPPEDISPAALPAVRRRSTEPMPDDMIAKVHSLLDLAKFRHWDKLLLQMKSCSASQLNYRPRERMYGMIHFVALAGELRVMEKLIDQNADILATTKGGANALHIAKKHGHHDMVHYLERLMHPGEDAPARIIAEHAMLDAAKDNNWEHVFAKLDALPDLVNARPAERDFALLHHAAFTGDEAVLQKLVEKYKADVSQRTKAVGDSIGQTALEVALDGNHKNAVMYLESVMPAVSLNDDFVAFPEPQLVRVDDAELLQRFRTVLNDCHKPRNNWTRDRRAATDNKDDPNTPVPTGYEFVAAFRNENAALWRVYQIQREVIKRECKDIADFNHWKPWTSSGTSALDGKKELELMAGANEWLLFHASIPEALEGIARTGFKMAKVAKGADSIGGGLYGEGAYFTDSITKADEYARKRVSGGEFEGCRTAALVRVTGGHVLRVLDEVKQEDKATFCQHVFEDKYHSVLGDRLRLKGTFREYVAYQASQFYLEYVIYYKRLGIADKYQ
eukprot:TRINITY_DN106631_c0_g1_i1.p1 TRINITY_DN106631_c0_g1~~TRINITY_DN106631_c0_g1_i1.p1  ORF type:complete len:609 (-),score=106.95 TRINITY_DN106631_c0_g1_i1:235-2061(-)